MPHHEPIPVPQLDPVATLRQLFAKVFSEADRRLIIGPWDHLRANDMVVRAQEIAPVNRSHRRAIALFGNRHRIYLGSFLPARDLAEL
jgi:hypothetical protein